MRKIQLSSQITAVPCTPAHTFQLILKISTFSYALEYPLFPMPSKNMNELVKCDCVIFWSSSSSNQCVSSFQQVFVCLTFSCPTLYFSASKFSSCPQGTTSFIYPPVFWQIIQEINRKDPKIAPLGISPLVLLNFAFLFDGQSIKISTLVSSWSFSNLWADLHLFQIRACLCDTGSSWLWITSPG